MNTTVYCQGDEVDLPHTFVCSTTPPGPVIYKKVSPNAALIMSISLFLIVVTIALIWFRYWLVDSNNTRKERKARIIADKESQDYQHAQTMLSLEIERLKQANETISVASMYKEPGT